MTAQADTDTVQQLTEAFDARVQRREQRRDFFRNALGAMAVTAAGASALTLAGKAEAQAAALTDPDILNFALNLEYLEAQFYAFATSGTTLAANLLTGTGTPGAVNTAGGAAVTFTDPVLARYAREIAADEVAHVTFLRSQLGASAVSQPALDLSVSATSAFSKAAAAAKVITAGQVFNQYGSEDNFLLAAFLFEDVGVTAYKGAAPLLTKTYVEAAAGILAVEAYHAATIRGELFRRGSVAGSTLIATTSLLSDARDSLDGGTEIDQGITPGTTVAPGQVSPTPTPTATATATPTATPTPTPTATATPAPTFAVSNIVPTDANAIAFSRTPNQVLNIVYLNAAASSGGGFFPSGLNGTIRAATAAA
jgi:hypothetical protein